MAMKPDKDYDIYHLGISGGKDSTAALLWLVHESGYPHDKIRVTFCDTGNEHQITYDYIAMLSEKVFHIETIKPPLDFYELAKKKGRFPSVKARFCTQELKIFPSQRYVLNLMRDGAKVLLLTGVRASESKKRADLPEFEWDSFYACDMFRPLLHWSLNDVWAMLAKCGIPRNQLYDYGAKRVGCLPCIMSRKAEIRMIARNFPERIDMIRKAELETGRISTFYCRTFVPPGNRSREIVTEKGVIMKVPTIDDVVAWSQTARGGRQYDFDFDGPMMCSSNLGACE
jgi:3'-phosphoadenosine 5'-phosphosulfate sulfotransferase (PAPS reductase)/FAD synthetase